PPPPHPRHDVEAGVGAAVANVLEGGRTRREDLFLQTKFTPADGQDERIPYDPDADVATQVRQSAARSLEHLRTTYVDSFVLHGPYARRGLQPEDVAVWRAMESLHDGGTTRLLGVSNVTLEQVEAFHRLARIKPALVQNRCFPATRWGAALRRVCAAHRL